MSDQLTQEEQDAKDQAVIAATVDAVNKAAKSKKRSKKGKTVTFSTRSVKRKMKGASTWISAKMDKLDTWVEEKAYNAFLNSIIAGCSTMITAQLLAMIWPAALSVAQFLWVTGAFVVVIPFLLAVLYMIVKAVQRTINAIARGVAKAKVKGKAVKAMAKKEGAKAVKELKKQTPATAGAGAGGGF